MSNVISIEYPAFLANTMRLNNRDFEKEIKISALVKLFELGKISSGTAAKALGLSRVDFLELLSDYKVSFLLQDNLAQEVENA
ncbi:MAG TPA: Fis family transcriptional regulator [Porphyromonadaceae bacterium]|jgi:predicted HTH domain antitoxin|nr:Fis family transcriptional regulator [Porphyromonadaceae bacterium]HBL32373.1 Fis family transcriptional regulator [Porphyromonadaceae bacterium]HBX20980.1 Fis family transcriptional regulator [Porphyromonadaceae bacterium]HCM20023.1 Fis family transcriptional regulator [Porphyromonadaceae bacterium]